MSKIDYWSVLLLVWVCIAQFAPASSRNFAQEININLDSRHHCFRMLNGTHQVGCQSSFHGNIGVVHVRKHKYSPMSISMS